MDIGLPLAMVIGSAGTHRARIRMAGKKYNGRARERRGPIQPRQQLIVFQLSLSLFYISADT